MSWGRCGEECSNGQRETERDTHSRLEGPGHGERMWRGVWGEGLRRRTHNHPEVGAGGREEDEEEKRW